MKLQLNRVAHPVTVLGPGRRLGLWVQGCHIRCAGCASVDTWDPAGGRPVDTEELADDLASTIVENRLTGLTITGGEPSEQDAALADLVIRLRAALDERPEWAGDLDVLVFTGVAARTAARRLPGLFPVADAAVCGPYRRERPSDRPLIATENQELVLLSDLGRERYALLDDGPRVLQARVDATDITLIGLPGPGDLERLEAALKERGVQMRGRSWSST